MLPIHVQLQNSTLRRVLRRLHFPLEIMLVCVRWYAADAPSTRNLGLCCSNGVGTRKVARAR